MMNESVVFAVEIGRRAVRVVAGSVGPRGVTVRGAGSCPAWGMREDGLLVDPLQLSESIRSAVLEVEDECGERAARVHAAVPATLLRTFEVTGHARIGGAESGALGARRAQERALAGIEPDVVTIKTRLCRVSAEPVSSLDEGCEDLDFAATYSVLGIRAHELAPMRRAIELCGLEVDGLTAAPLAAIETALTTEEREDGAILLHLEGGLVDVATARNGVVQHAGTTTLPYLARELERLGGIDILPSVIVLSGEEAEAAAAGHELGYVVPVRLAGEGHGGLAGRCVMAPCIGLLAQACELLAPTQLPLLASA